MLSYFGPIGSDSSDFNPETRGSLCGADLHVHSWYSGPGHLHGLGLRCGVGDPVELYRTAKARGMDVVTLTDIDTIDGCLELLDRRPDATDFMISEEVVATEPRSGRRLHVLFYDITEAQHREIQHLKGDVREMMAYARSSGMVSSLSPAAQEFPADAWAREGSEEILSLFEWFEIKNGSLGRTQNDLAARMVQQAARERRLGVTAGSGAHGPRRVGQAITVSRANSRTQFLEELRCKRTWTFGTDGGVLRSAEDLSRMLARHYRAHLGGAQPGGHDATGRSMVRAILALPLHIVGAPFWLYGMRRARATVHARRARKRLDSLEVRSFQRRTKAYEPATLDADHEGTMNIQGQGRTTQPI